jgi:DNA-binding transcriptional LysR family regulator
MKRAFTIPSTVEMTPDLLPAVAAFVRVARLSSFTRAAAEMNVSPSALSQTVRSLEARIGTQLLSRTTRRVGLTEMGTEFLQRVQPGLDQIGAAFTRVDELRDAPIGSLRINLPRIANHLLLMPRVTQFMAAYPDIQLDLTLDDGLTDIIAGGFDAGIRLGESLQQDMIAVRISPEMRQVTAAAPAYLKRRGVPQRPEQVREHDCIDVRYVSSGTIYRWEFASGRGRARRTFEIETKARFVTNDFETSRRAACAGIGLGSFIEASIRNELDAGLLLPVLEAWAPNFPGFYLYYPNRAHLPRKLRVFIEFLQAGMTPEKARSS